MTIDNIREIVESDLELKDLELNNFDLLTAYQYIQIRGTIVDGYKPVLKTKPYIEISYQPTEDEIERLNKERFLKSLELFNSAVYLQEANFNNFNVNTNDRKNALDRAVNFCNDYIKGNHRKGLYIYGRFSTGKSYLTSAIAHELFNNGYNVLFTFMPDLVRAIKDGINQNDLEYRVNALRNCDVLILDDIGGENMSAWFRDEVLLPILQFRLNAKKPVLFSSNLKLEQLVEKMDVQRNKISSYSAARVIQRIIDLSDFVSIGDLPYSKIKENEYE